MDLAQLRDEVIRAKIAYYNTDNPVMSDEEYDELEQQLIDLSPDGKNDKALSIGAPIEDMLNKAEHSINMGSQDKFNSEEEYLKWMEKYGYPSLHVSLKMDGGSVAAYYTDGYLTQAISRGDGKIGEDITANAMKFKGLPLYVEETDGIPFNGAVRFEAVLTIDDWKTIRPNHDVINCVDDNNIPVNPRNIGNGILGRKDGFESEYITAFAFDIVSSNNKFKYETHKSAWLEERGFIVIPYDHRNNAKDYYDEIANNRDTIHNTKFWIDGIVLKINDIELQENAGITSDRPKGQRAWKFKSKGAETVLLGVEWTVGHTGALIPNGRLKPVVIEGTKVSNVLLNNHNEIKRLGIGINDSVYVIKANDIIPKITKLVKKSSDSIDISIPSECPSCGSNNIGHKSNVDNSQSAMAYCLNTDCEAQISCKIKRWIKSLDILGIGDSILNAMIKTFYFSDPSGLYQMGEDYLADLIINEDKDIRLGLKRAKNILNNIAKTKILTIPEFIGSLGINYLGKRRVQLMIEGEPKLNDIDRWLDNTLNDAEIQANAGVPGIGNYIVDAIYDNKIVINRLLDFITVKKLDLDGVDTVVEIDQFTVCITGSLPSGKKKNDYNELLSQSGGKLIDKVTKDLTYLVVSDLNAPSSNKRKKAESYGVQIIDETGLCKMLES